MDYKEWSSEYYREAENLLPVVEKYKAKLKNSRGINYEDINSILNHYRNIYYDLLNTARMLEARAGEKPYAA